MAGMELNEINYFCQVTLEIVILVLNMMTLLFQFTFKL